MITLRRPALSAVRTQSIAAPGVPPSTAARAEFAYIGHSTAPKAMPAMPAIVVARTGEPITAVPWLMLVPCDTLVPPSCC